MTSPVRLTHNRLLFTVPLDLPGQLITNYIHFCSDDAVKQVGELFRQKYKKMQLNDTVIFNNVINLLLTRKIKYDQERSGLMKWVEWDNEKFANKIGYFLQLPLNKKFVFVDCLGYVGRLGDV